MKQQLLRIKILAAIFVLVTTWAFVKLFSGNGSAENSFAKISIDTSGVESITIIGDSLSTQLKKEGIWMVNGKYKVRKDLSQLLLTAVSRMEIKRSVAKENEKNVLSILSKKGYTLQTNGQKQFTIAVNENDANSSYYVKSGETTPYIIHVPGFTGSLTDLVKQKEEVWRYRTLFACTPMSLQLVKLEYPDKPNSNFEIKYVRPQEFEFVGATKLDTSLMIGFLEQFQEVNVDQFLTPSENQKMKSKLKTEKPICMLTVSDLSPESSQTVLFYAPTKERNAFYGLLKERDEVVTFSMKTIERILARREFFIPKK